MLLIVNNLQNLQLYFEVLKRNGVRLGNYGWWWYVNDTELLKTQSALTGGKWFDKDHEKVVRFYLLQF